MNPTPAPFPMSAQDLIPIIDQASSKSDRWLFLAMLVIVLFCMVACIRYLVKRNEEQSKDHNTLVREMVVVLHECKDVMAKVLAKLDKLHVLLLTAGLMCAGCAGTGPNGEFTPRDIESVTGSINTAVGMYEHLRYPDRLINPPGAPFPVIPPSAP